MADEFYGNADKVALSTSYVGVDHSQKSMVLLCVVLVSLGLWRPT